MQCKINKLAQACVAIPLAYVNTFKQIQSCNSIACSKCYPLIRKIVYLC